MALANKKNRYVKFQRNILPYYYLVPAFLIMGVITFYPLIYQVIISFTNFETKDLLLGLNSPVLKFVGLKNYIDIFTGALPVENFNFFRVLEFNFWWALSNVMLHVPAGILIATLLNTEGLWLKKVYRALYILPVVIPPIVVATVWRNIFDGQYGAMNQFLTVITAYLGQTDPVRRGRRVEVGWLSRLERVRRRCTASVRRIWRVQPCAARPGQEPQSSDQNVHRARPPSGTRPLDRFPLIAASKRAEGTPKWPAAVLASV